MVYYVDTREPIEYRKIAQQMGFAQMAKDVGDYSSDHAIVERKTFGDLINSIYARYGQTGRFWDQVENMAQFAKTHEVVPFVLVHGNYKNFILQREAEGQSVNLLSVYGAIASSAVRYDVTFIWIELEKPEDVLYCIKSILEKVEEGKHLLPFRKRLKEFAKDRTTAILMKTFELSYKQASILAAKFGNLYNLLNTAKTNPSAIWLTEGIGMRTFNKIRELGGIT